MHPILLCTDLSGFEHQKVLRCCARGKKEPFYPWVEGGSAGWRKTHKHAPRLEISGELHTDLAEGAWCSKVAS